MTQNKFNLETLEGKLNIIEDLLKVYNEAKRIHDEYGIGSMKYFEFIFNEGIDTGFCSAFKWRYQKSYYDIEELTKQAKRKSHVFHYSYVPFNNIQGITDRIEALEKAKQLVIEKMDKNGK